MDFIIKVRYKTGDSFKTYETSEELDYNWDEQTAKKNALSIIEHYEAYSRCNDVYAAKNNDIEKIKKNQWYVEPRGHSWETSAVNANISLLLNEEGKRFLYLCPWCGYFETLISVEVKTKEFVLYPNY